MNTFEHGDRVVVTSGTFVGCYATVVNEKTRLGEVGIRLEDGTAYDASPSALRKLPAPDMVAHPNHYTAGVPEGVEVIDIIRAHMAAGGTWETGNALKYILRHTLKGNPGQDIAKAVQYLTMWTQQQQETA